MGVGSFVRLSDAGMGDCRVVAYAGNEVLGAPRPSDDCARAGVDRLASDLPARGKAEKQDRRCDVLRLRNTMEQIF